MAIQLNQFHATSEHQFQRSEQLKVNGREFSRDQLREQIEPLSDAVPIAATNASKPSTANHEWDDGELHNLDAITRLRVLVLASFTGRQLALSVNPEEASDAQAGVAARSEQGLSVNASATLGGLAEVDTGEAAEPPLLPAINLDKAVLVVDEREASAVAFSVDMSINGRQVVGELRVQQSRANHLEVRATAAGVQKFLDPLVLNFNGPLVLAEGNIRFDLDVDGQVDLLPSMVSDSYLLALDKNANGRIDDGSEVVGAQSGNGYADLRALDDNADGFLSQADASFQLLRLWRPGEQGIGQPLGARGVQAIYLGSIDSPFTLQASSNGELLGQVRQSSFFVANNKVQLSQQVDFWV